MTLEEISVLVVDDVATIRIQVKELLKAFGFRNILLAKNGEEAKTLLHQGDFHLVLCDWHMSPTNGLELLKYVRGEPAFKNLLFIFLTAEATKERVLEAIQAGVDGYMIKPVTVAQIQTKIYGLLLDRKVL